MKNLFFAKELMTADYQTKSIVVTVDGKLGQIKVDSGMPQEPKTIYKWKFDSDCGAKCFFAEVVNVIAKYSHVELSFETAISDLAYYEYIDEERLS